MRTCRNVCIHTNWQYFPACQRYFLGLPPKFMYLVKCDEIYSENKSSISWFYLLKRSFFFSVCAAYEHFTCIKHHLIYSVWVITMNVLMHSLEILSVHLVKSLIICTAAHVEIRVVRSLFGKIGCNENVNRDQLDLMSFFSLL